MTNTEYNKLLKFLYFEGYANSYEEADYILEDMSNIERKQLMMEATRMRKYFNKKYGNENEYGENEAAAKEAITRRKISRNRTPYSHPPIRGSSRHLQLARQGAKSQNEAYELLLDYLIDEGYTNTVDGAVTIIENMSDDWIDNILDEGYKSFPYEKVKAKVKKLKTDRESLGKKPLTGKSDSEISDILNKMKKSRNRENRLGLQSNIAHSFLPKQKEKSNRNRPESEKRSKTVEPQKSFGNRLTRSDKQGIKDSYEYDLYDIVLTHLIDEGYANTVDGAVTIIENMSEDWMESILDEAKTPKSPRNAEKTAQKAQQRKDRRVRQEYYGKKVVGFGSGEDLRPSN